MIDSMSAKSGRILKENDDTINIADILADVYDSGNNALKTTAQLGDIAIENVSIKDKDNAYYIKVNSNGSIDVNATLPAGDNNIGNVDVVTLPELPAGDNNIGNVDVVTLPALPAGDNNIGNVDIVTLPALPAGDNNIGNVDVVTLPSIPAGTNHIGKTGYTLKKISTYFTRPADTTQYTIGDAITNSTSSPAVFELDLSTVGAVAGQAIEIRKLAVVSSAKQSTLPLVNVFLSPTTFTLSNDNAALDIADATMEAGGCWVQCTEQNFTASNSRVASSNLDAPMILAVADTKLYGCLQAANAYTPVSEEKFTVITWIALL